ncbi:aldehyde dehydrogenase family protein [Halorubrum sp. DTA46]|uniref:aldehyde dehydrogenase family protein n=1 Tax=Halorubrum sp. DTA46 TaxID=3402162 RepID=UPI003AAB4564
MESEPFENEQTVFTQQRDETMDEFHRSYDRAIETLKTTLGGTHSLRIDGQPVETDDHFTVTSPGDTSLEIGRFADGTADAVDRAVTAASDTFDEWRGTHWSERAEIAREAADRMSDRKYELAAVLTLENGKNRTEAMADIDEGIDFLRFYSRELERNGGYVLDTGEPTPRQHCTNHLEPFGVFGVVGPFNFPFAIFSGMTMGAVLTGNTVVAKPASTTPLIAHEIVNVLSEAGLPDGVVNLVTGGGRAVGQPLVEHQAVDGVVFTGSRDVGRTIQQTFFEQEKNGPVIAELGGKNPVIVTANADLQKAVSGVKNGAFGFSGQKCSATARVYVEEGVVDQFTQRLVSETEALPIQPPEHEDAFLAPLIDESAEERYRSICDAAREEGTVLTGRNTVASADLPDGRYVEPTVVTDIPHGHELAREEHFLPFVTIHPVSDLDEAITKANESEYGLCAGLFSEDESEVTEWFERIESGMCYVNRHQSATTGALVQAQPFGGWKSSGTTSKFAGGYWYLPQFMREQTRTVVGEVGRQ